MLKLFQERKKDKLANLIKENQVTLYRMAYSYVHNEEAAKDIVQDTILQAYKKLDTLKEDNYMKTWLIRILINQSLDTLRRQKRKNEDTLEYQDNLSSTHDSSFYEYSDLYHAVNQLDDKIRTVIVLRYFEEMKFEEIAKITDTNINTVKSQVYKGLTLLKENMQEEEKWIHCTERNRTTIK